MVPLIELERVWVDPTQTLFPSASNRHCFVYVVDCDFVKAVGESVSVCFHQVEKTCVGRSVVLVSLWEGMA